MNSIDLRTKQILVYLVLIVLAVFSYHALPQCGFTNLDDSAYVQGNSIMGHGLSLYSLKWAFTTFQGSYWIPLTWLSLLFDAQLYGMNAGGYHLTNLLFHIVNGFLLFFLLNKATRRLWPSAFVAIFFMVHPLQVESVAWISERKDVLSVFFWMLTITVYLYYVAKPRKRLYVLMFFVFALGLMAKPMIVTLPCVLLLFDFWPLGRFTGSSIKENTACLGKLIAEKAPLFFLAVLFSGLTVFTQGQTAMLDLETVPFFARMGNVGVNYLAYLHNIFLPVKLAVFYPLNMEGPGLAKGLAAWAILGLISCAVIVFRKRAGYLFIGWFIFVGVLFPVSGILQSGYQGMADRFAYIPVIGIFIMVAYGISDLAERFKTVRSPAIAVGIAAVMSCSILTAKQVEYWKTSVTLLQHTVAVTKDNWFAEQILGNALEQEKRLDEALIHLKRSLEGNPEFPSTHNTMGMVLYAKGDFEQASSSYQKAIAIAPFQPQYYNNLGLSFFQLGENQKAIASFNKGIELEPNSHQLQFNIGLLYQKMHDYKSAEIHFKKALELNPEFLYPYNHLGRMALEEKNYDAAVQFFQPTLLASQGLAPTKLNLAKILVELKEYEKALPLLEEIVKTDPSDKTAQDLLAKTRSAL